MDVGITMIAVLPIVLMMLGSSMIWAGTRNQPREVKSASVWPRAVRLIGAILLAVGLFAFIGLMTHVFMLVFWLATAVILAAIAKRYYDAEAKSLVWLLTTAAERGIPLDTAALAFSQDRQGRLGVQATRLADYLEAGLPLGLALQRSGYRLSPAVLLAADLGQQTGSLGVALRQAAQHGESVDKAARSTAVWFFYLAFLATYTLVIGMFCMTWLMPWLQRIYAQFNLELPAATRELIEFSSFVSSYRYVMLPLWLVVLAGFALAIAHYIGFSTRRLPIVRRFWWRTDCALVLRWLGIVVRQNRSLTEAVQLLAGYFPQPVIRRRLEQTGQRIARGSHWCDSLRMVGLVRSSECGLFKAAERAGNLSWALDEIADSAVRRSVQRLKAWMDVVFPLAVIGLGLAVLFLALGVLLPIFSLILALA